MNIEIIHQTKDWIVINKPEGLSVHNDPQGNDLVQLLQKQLRASNLQSNKQFIGIEKLFPVHRLDAQTSGLMILACNQNAARDLAQLFEQKKIHKYYLAIVKGKIEADGEWNQPLTDKAEGRRAPAGTPVEQKPCKTSFHPLQSTAYFTLLRIKLDSGRQHQIRKHAALNKTPLIGDTRYYKEDYQEMIKTKYNFARLALHAYQLEFSLPSGAPQSKAMPSETFKFSAAMPEEFCNLGFSKIID